MSLNRCDIYLAATTASASRKQGWKGIKNSELLALAAKEFDLLITSDQSIRYQQNLLRSTIAVLELSTYDLRRIRAAASMIQSEVSTIKPGVYRRVIIP